MSHSAFLTSLSEHIGFFRKRQTDIFMLNDKSTFRLISTKTSVLKEKVPN